MRLFNAKKDAAAGGGQQLDRLAGEIHDRMARAGLNRDRSPADYFVVQLQALVEDPRVTGRCHGLDLVVTLAVEAALGLTVALQLDSGMEGLLLLGGEADVVPAAGSYPAEDSQTRMFAPARLGATAAESRTADSQCVGGAGANG